MTLSVSCPNCAFNFPLQAGTNDADARRFAACMGQVPPAMANELLKYLQLFKPPVQNLTWGKALKRIKELMPDIETQSIKYNGRKWQAPPELWAQAIETMLERMNDLDLPMNNHNYLYKILSGLADKLEAEVERNKEQRLRHGQDPKPAVNNNDELSRLKADLMHFKKLYDMKPTDHLKKQIDDVEAKIKHLS